MTKWFLGAAAMMLALHGAAAAESAAAPGPVGHEVKRFMEAPPSIQKLVFRLRGPESMPLLRAVDPKTGKYAMGVADGNDAKVRSKWGVDEEGFVWYLARWQSNAFLLQQIHPEPVAREGITNLDPMGFASFGKCDGHYWYLRGTTLQEETQSASKYQGSNHLAGTVDALGKGILSKVLNLGVQNIGIGTIRWDGDGFEAASVAVPGVRIVGKADFEGRGLSRLNLLYNQHSLRVDYFYQEDAPLSLRFLPNRFVTHSLSGAKGVTICEAEILCIQVGSAPLEAAYFAPNGEGDKVEVAGVVHALHTSVAYRWQHTNGVVLEEKGGKVQAVARWTPPPERKTSSGWARFALLVVMIAPALWLLARRTSKRRDYDG
jgi:hypothetical protein